MRAAGKIRSWTSGNRVRSCDSRIICSRRRTSVVDLVGPAGGVLLVGAAAVGC